MEMEVVAGEEEEQRSHAHSGRSRHTQRHGKIEPSAPAGPRDAQISDWTAKASGARGHSKRGMSIASRASDLRVEMEMKEQRSDKHV